MFLDFSLLSCVIQVKIGLSLLITLEHFLSLFSCGLGAGESYASRIDETLTACRTFSYKDLLTFSCMDSVPAHSSPRLTTGL